MFEPEDREVSFAWSWCPARGEAADGFRCLVEEGALESFFGTSGALPPYDLGTEQTAELDAPFSEEQAAALCGLLIEQAVLDEELVLRCLEGLEPSVELRVTTDDDELVAIASVPLATTDSPEARNANPEFDGELQVREAASGRVLDAGEPLRADGLYVVRVGVDPESAQRFLPEAEPGLPEPVERLETLVMTWFVTMGETEVAEPPNGVESRGQRTSFVDGETDFAVLLENTWQLPATLATNEARLVVVLRDERDGVNWAEHRFSVEAAP